MTLTVFLLSVACGSSQNPVLMISFPGILNHWYIYIYKYEAYHHVSKLNTLFFCIRLCFDFTQFCSTSSKQAFACNINEPQCQSKAIDWPSAKRRIVYRNLRALFFDLTQTIPSGVFLAYRLLCLQYLSWYKKSHIVRIKECWIKGTFYVQPHIHCHWVFEKDLCGIW